MAEAHPESSSATKAKLAAATFFLAIFMTAIISVGSAPQPRTLDLIGQGFRYRPNKIGVSVGQHEEAGPTGRFPQPLMNDSM